VGHYLFLIPIGFVVGAYGTLIGAGGGFVLMPILLLLYPHESPEALTSISLAVVFFNALSGSAAYARMRRVDYRSGLLFAAATVPGAILGALTTAYIPRHLFDLIFGLLLVAMGAVLLRSPHPRRETATEAPRGALHRVLVEASGTRHAYAYNPVLGVGLSLVVGYLSSLLGIGGGIIHVPALVHLLNFPVHIATATSHFILAIMTLAGSLVHFATGALARTVGRVVPLALGVCLGAQLGARLSDRVHGVWIMRGLALALAFVGLRILLQAL
jgi:hypothetical protein